MTVMARRAVPACFLFSVILISLSCSTSNTPEPGTPGFYWGAARQTYAAGDYQKTIENLGNIVSTQNEYVERAQPWLLVLTSGMAQGNVDLAEAFEAGTHANRAQVTNFRRQVNTYRGNANTLAMQFAEGFSKFQTGGDTVTLAFAYPTGSPTEDLQLNKVAGGAWPRDADLEAIQKHAIERAVLLATCRAAGARNDPGKASELLKTGDAKVPRATFVAAMATALFEQSQLYAHNKLDQPEKFKIFCTRAEDALKPLPASKDTQDLDKKIQAAMKKNKA